jgi:hypothetical protein
MHNLGYLGMIELASTLRLAVQCRNGSAVVTAPDAAPTWSIYGSTDTPVLTGSLGAADADSKTGFRTGNAAITSGNGFAAGQRYIVRVAYAISSTAYAAEGSFHVV